MNQPIFTDASELTAALRTRSTSPIGIISVDGVDGVGKSTLAQRLAADLDLPYVEVDEFVQPEQGGYVDYVGYDLLKVVVEPYGLGMVIEGICIKHVLSRLAIDEFLSIYVRRTEESGLWLDMIRLFPPDGSADEVVEERRASGLPLGHIEEIIRYHYSFLPHTTSDYIFEIGA